MTNWVDFLKVVISILLFARDSANQWLKPVNVLVGEHGQPDATRSAAGQYSAIVVPQAGGCVRASTDTELEKAARCKFGAGLVTCSCGLEMAACERRRSGALPIEVDPGLKFLAGFLNLIQCVPMSEWQRGGYILW